MAPVVVEGTMVLRKIGAEMMDGVEMMAASVTFVTPVLTAQTRHCQTVDLGAVVQELESVVQHLIVALCWRPSKINFFRRNRIELIPFQVVIRRRE